MMKQRRISWRAWAAMTVSALGLVACGGGSSSGGPSVSNMAANNTIYGRTMTVTVSGAALSSPDLQLDVQGPCSDMVRATPALDFQATFTCRVEGIGTITSVIRDAAGAELGRLRVNIPAPQVRFTVLQGGRSGVFVVELDPVAAPITALNFIRYVNAGFYRDTIFHRVLPNQIVQGGQYTTDLSLRPALFDPIKLESDNGLKNLRGTIAMARAQDPNSASAQFYINLVDNPAFDRQGAEIPGYAVFGKLITGQEFAAELGRVPVASISNEFPSLPLTNIVMTAVVQTQ